LKDAFTLPDPAVGVTPPFSVRKKLGFVKLAYVLLNDVFLYTRVRAGS